MARAKKVTTGNTDEGKGQNVRETDNEFRNRESGDIGQVDPGLFRMEELAEMKGFKQAKPISSMGAFKDGRAKSQIDPFYHPFPGGERP